MPDITTTRIFTDGEKGITATKMNDIIGSSSIQPSFYSAKPVASTVDPADQMLVLKAAGTYAQAPFSTVISSVSSQLPSSDPEIWSVRLRSFNAIGNPTFEVDQINVGNLVAAPAASAKSVDRWIFGKAGTSVLSTQQIDAGAGVGGGVLLPGTNFVLTGKYLRYTLTTAQATLAAGDYISPYQYIEGPRWRELKGDIHSFQLLVRTSVAGLRFGIAIVDSPTTQSLVNLSPALAANTWTLVTLPNLPTWPSGGNFSSAPGAVGYLLRITLACGTTYTAPANGTWQTGYFFGASGQSNFAASPVNSTFDIAFVQHEPGPQCSTPMDKPFSQSLDECLRYYCKSLNYATKPGSNSGGQGPIFYVYSTNLSWALGWSPFPKPMAKAPTVTPYANDGTINGGTIFGGGNWGISSVTSLEKGFPSAALASAFSGANAISINYVADTGW
jgi:hypothetical protein